MESDRFKDAIEAAREMTQAQRDVLFGKNYMPSVDETLSQRNQTHGDFADNARFMQTIKEICRSERGWNKLDYVKREAVEAIIVKIGRILTGDPNHKDNWHDIAGYALLAKEKSD